MKRSLLPLFLLAGLIGGAGGWWFDGYLRSEPVAETPPPAGPDDLLGKPRPGFTLGSIDGAIVSSADFDGSVLLVNFWATWCAPCRKEMPMLSRLHEEYAHQGLQVLGIALDDVQRARDFVSELGVSYPVLVGMADVLATGRAYGNTDGLLPYTVLIDRQGIVRWTRLGELERDEVVQQASDWL